MKQKIINIAIITLLVVSIGFNIYTFGWQKVRTKYQQQGYNACLNGIVQVVQQIGEVKIGEMVLIPQTQAK